MCGMDGIDSDQCLLWVKMFHPVVNKCESKKYLILLVAGHMLFVLMNYI